MMIFMVLENNSYDNTQNLKSSDNSTNNQKRINSSHINSNNAASTSTSNGTTTPLLMYHQNIRGLRYKIDELFMLWSTDLPQVLCFTEHQLSNDELNCSHITSYNLGAKYCRVN